MKLKSIIAAECCVMNMEVSFLLSINCRGKTWSLVNLMLPIFADLLVQIWALWRLKSCPTLCHVSSVVIEAVVGSWVSSVKEFYPSVSFDKLFPHGNFSPWGDSSISVSMFPCLGTPSLILIIVLILLRPTILLQFSLGHLGKNLTSFCVPHLFFFQ